MSPLRRQSGAKQEKESSRGDEFFTMSETATFARKRGSSLSEQADALMSSLALTAPPAWWKGSWTGFTLYGTSCYLSTAVPALVLSECPAAFGGAQRVGLEDSAQAPLVSPAKWGTLGRSFAPSDSEMAHEQAHYLAYLVSPTVETTVTGYRASAEKAVLECTCLGADLAGALEYYVSQGAGHSIRALAAVLRCRPVVSVEFRTLSGAPSAFGAPVIGAAFPASLTLLGRALVSTTADWYPSAPGLGPEPRAL